jgi:hypothetical protein
MNLLPGLNWFRSMATRRDAATPTAPDPGDMGTAFGLDASMEELPRDTPPETPPLQADSLWNRRLVRRPQR